MLRVPAVEIKPNVRGGLRAQVRTALARLQVGQVIMFHSTSSAAIDRTLEMARAIQPEIGATFQLLGREERVRMRPRPKTIGLWRESGGHWLYLLKHSQEIGASRPWRPLER